jgi:hypothetical protein
VTLNFKLTDNGMYWLRTIFDIPINPYGAVIETTIIEPIDQFRKYQFLRRTLIPRLTKPKFLSYIAYNFSCSPKTKFLQNFFNNLNFKWMNGIIPWRRTTNNILTAAYSFIKLSNFLKHFELLQHNEIKESYWKHFLNFKLTLKYEEIPSFIFFSLDFIPYVQNMFYCYIYFRADLDSWKHLRFLTFEADPSCNYFKYLHNLDDIFPMLFQKRAKILILIRHTLFHYKFHLRRISVFDVFFHHITHQIKKVLFMQDLPARQVTNMRIRLELTCKDSIATLNQ